MKQQTCSSVHPGRIAGLFVLYRSCRGFFVHTASADEGVIRIAGRTGVPEKSREGKSCRVAFQRLRQLSGSQLICFYLERLT